MNIRSTRRNSSRHNQTGVTLVEVLVTAVIISIGLLGVAALHLTSLRNSQDSDTRSKAVWLTTDIIERMRANRQAARSDKYNVAIGGTLTPGTIASNDVNAWKVALADKTLGLPGGDGSILTKAVGTSIVFTVTVQWMERDGSHAFVTKTEI